MNQDHRETKALIQQTAEKWGAIIAEAKVLSPRTPAERQAAAAVTKREAQDYIAANPFAQDCGRMPAVGSLSAASLNAQAGYVRECYRRWHPHAAEVKGILGSFQRRYADLGGTDSLIKDEIGRWSAAQAERGADLARFNAAVDAHERDVGSRAAATPPPALARRQQSYKRRQTRRSSDGGHDYAREFFERQRNPPPPHFRPAPPPPKPNGYLGTGYW